MSEYYYNFVTDESLMYLIQQETKLSTIEIIGFFYDLSKAILEIGMEKRKDGQDNIRKDVRDYFPNTNIPFKILVKTNQTGHATIRTHVHIEVSFPDNSTRVDYSKILEMIVEKTLLGASTAEDFPRPKPKTPRIYKDLIGQALKKNV